LENTTEKSIRQVSFAGAGIFFMDAGIGKLAERVLPPQQDVE
jgi:hypothetical protein